MASSSLRSSSVTLDNIDDYLAPSQACVNPAFQPSTKMGEGDEKEGSLKPSTGAKNVVVPRRRRRIVRKKIISTSNNSNTAAELPETSTTALSMVLSQQQQQQQQQQPTEEKNTKKAVKASMADCLACSGCVTTAETVMMEERHSLKSLRNRLSSSSSSSSSSGGKDRSRIVTISPNSWADMCRHWNLQQQSRSHVGGDQDKTEKYPCHNHKNNSSNNDNNSNIRNNIDGNHHYFYFSRFTTLLHKILSVKVVVDGNIPLQWTWIDEAQEFCQIYNENQEPKRSNDTSPSLPLPSMAIDSSKTLYYKSDGSSEIRANANRSTPNLPLISGSCPALVCLVEKTLTKLVPHLSQSMSPMSLVGMILNHGGDHNDNNNNNNNNNDKASTDTSSMDTDGVSTESDKNSNWDHWAIMPCHDKKLEASRKDFANPKNSKDQAVDLVISTQECVELVEEWIRSQQQQQQQQQQKDDQMQIQEELPPNMSVANYLSTLSPSDVSTTVLEPEDLLQLSSPYTTDDKSPPLLLTTPTICREDATTKSATTAMAKTAVQTHPIAFSSGGHANFIFRYAAKKLFGCTFAENDGDNNDNDNDKHDGDHGMAKGVTWRAASLATKKVRSARLGGKLLKQHYYETKLYRYRDGSYGTATPIVSDHGEELSTVVLHFAIAHGMQTMQRALKQVVERPIGATTGNGSTSNSHTLHYLEAMACPHGCVNGGGSVRSSLSLTNTNTKTSSSANLIRETPTETRQRVQSTLTNLKVPHAINNGTSTAMSINSHHLVPLPLPLPRTEYHVVPPMNYTTGAVAGEKVENMIW